VRKTGWGWKFGKKHVAKAYPVWPFPSFSMTVMTICWTISRCYLLVHIFLDYAAPLRPFLMGSCGSLTQRQQDESMKGWKMMEYAWISLA
jgi:hypothetical protein